MKKLFLLLSICFSFTAKAQFAVTNGATGFVNVRQSTSAISTLVEKLANGIILYSFDNEGDWIAVNFKKDSVDTAGFVIKEELIMVSGLEPIPYRYSAENKTILEKGHIKIVLATRGFVKGDAVFGYYNDSPGVLQSINGKEIFGTDGEIPMSQYRFVDVTMNGKTISIPPEGLENVFEPRLENTTAYYDREKDVLYIHASNSDGAGAYDLLWVIDKGQYKARHAYKGF